MCRSSATALLPAPRAFLAASLAYHLCGGIAEKITCPVSVGRGESVEFFRGQPEELVVVWYTDRPGLCAGMLSWHGRGCAQLADVLRLAGGGELTAVKQEYPVRNRADSVRQ